MTLASMAPHIQAAEAVCCPTQEASADVAESLADLPADALLHMGCDSGGSRAFEAFLNGHASAKVKKRVIRKLKGSYGKLAGTPGGSHVVQTAYVVAVCTSLLLA
jgi:hypothetical protein